MCLKGHVDIGLQRTQSLQIVGTGKRLLTVRANPWFDVDSEAHRPYRGDDVGEQDGGVDVVTADRLQGDFSRPVGILNGVENRAVASHREVLGKRAAGLTLEPHRNPVARELAGCPQQWRKFFG